jgi:hypothetical protein
LWWMSAPSTCGPYRGVGVSSMASVNRPTPFSDGVITVSTRYAAIVSAFLPAAATVV